MARDYPQVSEAIPYPALIELKSQTLGLHLANPGGST
jgi:hypothetical protein